MKAKHLIFDLDGTLVDSLPGIEASTRYAAATCLPGQAVPPMESLIGPPVMRMFANLWPDLDELQLGRLVSAFRRHYNAEGCLLSELYPGVEKTLAQLQANGAILFVLTNKPLVPAQSILRNVGIIDLFGEVVSPDSFDPAFSSKSEGATYLKNDHDLKPARTFLMGDGADDFAAAQACEFGFIAAGYGYGGVAARNQISHVAKSFPNILDIVL